MSKTKKLVINLIIIIILLGAIYHFGGFYISKEQCIVEYLRGMHVSQGDTALEIEKGNMVYTVLIKDEADMLVSESSNFITIVGTQKIGFLHRAKSYKEASGDENNLSVSWVETDDSEGYIVVANRKDDSIARAEVMMSVGKDTMNLTFEEWNENYAGTYVEAEQMFLVTYQTYDESGKLIQDLWGMY